MPWLCEEVPEWGRLSDDEEEAYREVVRDLGMDFPDDEDPD